MQMEWLIPVWGKVGMKGDLLGVGDVSRIACWCWCMVLVALEGIFGSESWGARPSLLLVA